MSPEAVWHSKGFGPACARVLLWPFSGIYWLGWTAYEGVYRTGIKSPKEAHRPVVCIGSLVAGGSGKTPATIAVARLLRDMGRQVTVGASGYGSPAAAGASIAPEGSLSAREWGDEPAMIREEVPDVPLIVGRDRVLAAGICRKNFPDSVLVLDDGLQHLPLLKHLRICIEDDSPNRLVLPAGPYRQPHSAARRMDALIGRAPFRLEHLPPVLVDSDGGSPSTPTSANVVTAVARPMRLTRSLEESGVQVLSARYLPDHDPLSAGNLFEGLDPNLPVIVTQKDWVKLRDRQDLEGRRILVATRRTTIEPQAEFARWLAGKLDEITKA